MELKPIRFGTESWMISLPHRLPSRMKCAAFGVKSTRNPHHQSGKQKHEKKPSTPDTQNGTGLLECVTHTGR